MFSLTIEGLGRCHASPLNSFIKVDNQYQKFHKIALPKVWDAFPLSQSQIDKKSQEAPILKIFPGKICINKHWQRKEALLSQK